MKKVMFVVLVLLVATAAFALESGPSNKVGYTKITCGVGYTPFGIAFKCWDVPTGGIPTYGVPTFKPSSIVGDQSNCGTLSTADRIFRQGGDFAYRNSNATCNWAGNVEINATMRPSGAYWYWNRTASPRDLVIAGEADVTTAPDSAIVVGNQYKAFSWRDPRERGRDVLGLRADGFTGGSLSTSDRVWLQGGDYFYYNTTSNVWAGAVTTIVPGKAYWIQSKHATTWTYTYDPTASASSIDPNGPTRVSAGSDLMKIATPKTVTKAATATN